MIGASARSYPCDMRDPQAIEATKMWPKINRFWTSAGPNG